MSRAASWAERLAIGVDPVALSRIGGIVPDPWQERVLRSKSKRIHINASRQSGKSKTAATRAVHKARHQPESLTLLISPGLRQSAELLRKCSELHGDVEYMTDPERESVLLLELDNGSRIISLPGKEATVRTYTADLIIVDEASRVPDDLYRAIRPMLAVHDGELIVMSTPHGKRGFFYEIHHNQSLLASSDRLWEMYEVPWWNCPRISEEFIAEELTELGEYWFSQEYELKFLDLETSAFRAEDIEAMVDDDVEQWGGMTFGAVQLDTPDDPLTWDLGAAS